MPHIFLMMWELIVHGITWNMFHAFPDCVVAMERMADWMETIGMSGQLACHPIIVEMV